jgi:hypothetical protein
MNYIGMDIKSNGHEDVLVGETGIEPVTTDLEGRCSIQLSYSPAQLLILL